MRICRFVLCMALTATLGGCVGGGGGGGGDCRDGDEACSPGFACVAVAAGTAYACRAACDGAEDCLRDEVCGPDGVCIDRAPIGPGRDAEVTDPVLDAEVVDARPIRFLDAAPEPEDSDVVVVTPPDRGVQPGQCAVDRAPTEQLLLVIELNGFEGFPLYFAVDATEREGVFEVRFQSLTSRDRQRTGLVTAADPTELGNGGEFRIPTVELRVPPSANQLGGELVLQVAFEGAVRGDGSICGVLQGRMTQPPIGDVSGSPFAGRAFGDGSGDPWAACDGCLP